MKKTNLILAAISGIALIGANVVIDKSENRKASLNSPSTIDLIPIANAECAQNYEKIFDYAYEDCFICFPTIEMCCEVSEQCCLFEEPYCSG